MLFRSLRRSLALPSSGVEIQLKERFCNTDRYTNIDQTSSSRGVISSREPRTWVNRVCMCVRVFSYAQSLPESSSVHRPPNSSLPLGICPCTTTTVGAHRGAGSGASWANFGRDLLHRLRQAPRVASRGFRSPGCFIKSFVTGANVVNKSQG